MSLPQVQHYTAYTLMAKQRQIQQLVLRGTVAPAERKLVSMYKDRVAMVQRCTLQPPTRMPPAQKRF